MKRKIARTGLVIIFAAAVVASMAAPAQADDHHHQCSLAGAAGNWGFTDNGTVIGVGPRTAVGILTLDASGNVLNGKATSSLNGSIADEAFSGTYTVNPDCTGTFALSVFDLSGTLLFTGTLNLAWDDNMRELRFIFTSVVPPNGPPLAIAIAGDAKKMVP
jgi:hypothetical protein